MPSGIKICSTLRVASFPLLKGKKTVTFVANFSEQLLKNKYNLIFLIISPYSKTHLADVVTKIGEMMLHPQVF